MMRVSLVAALVLFTMLAEVQPARAQDAQSEETRRRFQGQFNELVARVRELNALTLGRPQRFRVVLIVSSTMAEPPADNIPADARKALEDMKAFLPFKSYRLFGTGEGDARRGQSAVIRIHGGDNQTFEIRVARDGLGLVSGPQPDTADSRLSLTFILRDVSDLSPSVPGGRVLFEGPSINTLVTMDIGETIVVGTSRVKGSRGLLVLLTALPGQEK